jgi:hypothetical protein
LITHYGNQTYTKKEQIWRAFLDKARTTGHQLRQDELRELLVKDMNEREIKKSGGISRCARGAEERIAEFQSFSSNNEQTRTALRLV